MYEFEVKNISCGHCVATVTRAIQEKDPKATVSIDLLTKRVAVESSAPETELRLALSSADYPAT